MTKTTSTEEFKDPLKQYVPVQYATRLERSLAEEPITAIQTQPFVEVESGVTVREAIRTLHSLKVSSLLVVDGGKLVGIFTERDVLERVAERFEELADHPVDEVMTENPLVVYETDKAAAGLSAIAVAGYRHVPVLNVEGRPVGIVSPHRVLAFVKDHL
ncbi:MAG: CBS domain-containing protein [Pirellulaceae bacterium]|nr:CBS domain-containing protein [Planctomycetales bacterium]